ncbi:MAG: DUF4234 domain-containing protein [Bradymonadaceae bacterium]|nr:DUF4234 domain-containing protein [Lujinxingiaceae bacterium]
MQRGEVKNPVTVLILTMVTCGIYAIIWILQTVADINKGLGREEFNAVKELVLSVVTCGLWGIWFQWRLCESVVKLQQAWGVKPQMEAPILFLMCIFGLGPFFIQQSLNAAWEQGTPGGAGGFGTPA